jgi:chromosome segregation ATPase
MNEPPELRRTLFGYRRQDVESILETRERMFEQATEEADRQRSEAERLGMELEKARAEIAAAREETRIARDETRIEREELSAQSAELRRELETARGELARVHDQRREAEMRAGGLQTEIGEARREVAALTNRLRAAEATETDLRARLAQPPAAPDTRDLDSVLEAAQEAIERIMTGARRTAEEDLARVQRTRDEIQAEIDRVRAWRERIDPIAREMAGEIAFTQTQMSQTAERVGAALQPMSDALTALSNRLEELGRAADATIASGERPDRVDLVSHERSEAADAETQPGESTAQQAAAGAPVPADPWPDPWR